jgi:hypothetical protein
MSRTRAFEFEIDFNGARVFASRQPLFTECRSYKDLERNIILLKEDLDIIAKAIKCAMPNGVDAESAYSQFGNVILPIPKSRK